MNSEIGEILYKKCRALQIFIYFNSQYRGLWNKKTHAFINSNKNNLYYPKEKYEKHMTKRVFDKNIDLLIELGLIKIIEYRYGTRESTIYGMGDEWIKYGKKDFYIENDSKRFQNKELKLNTVCQKAY